MAPIPASLVVINPENATQVTQLARWGGGYIKEIVYSPDGTILAVTSSIGIYLYDVASLAEVRFIESEDEVSGVTISPDDATLAFGLGDTIRLWQVSDGTLLQTLTGHTRGSVAWPSPPDTILASGSNDSTIRLWGMR